MKTSGRRVIAVSTLLSLLCAAGAACAEESERPPLPESLLTESATDVDAEAGGEVEYEANVATVGARAGGAHATLTSLEVEWRVLRQFGLRIEPSWARVVDAGATAGRNTFGVSGALAFGLFHDFPRDMHLQLEVLGRTLDSQNAHVFEPGESELPGAADLVSAVRHGGWTLRTTVGGEVGGSFAHAPVHTDLALLTGIVHDERYGYLAIEARADWAREAPLVIAPEVVVNTPPLGLPFRLGVAVPINVGAAATATSYGIFVRLILLTGREVTSGSR
jgi:hypothetical protein